MFVVGKDPKYFVTFLKKVLFGNTQNSSKLKKEDYVFTEQRGYLESVLFEILECEDLIIYVIRHSTLKTLMNEDENMWYTSLQEFADVTFTIFNTEEFFSYFYDFQYNF